MTPNEAQTTLPPTTTTAMRSLVAGLTKLHPTCGSSSLFLFFYFFLQEIRQKRTKLRKTWKSAATRLDASFFGWLRFVLGPKSQRVINTWPWAMDKRALPTTDHLPRVRATVTWLTGFVQYESQREWCKVKCKHCQLQDLTDTDHNIHTSLGALFQRSKIWNHSF